MKLYIKSSTNLNSKQLKEIALERWMRLVDADDGYIDTDGLVNDLLMDIAYPYYDEWYDDNDNPIWNVIDHLSDDQLIEFIQRCQDIEEKVLLE
jgi:hypothetical protein